MNLKKIFILILLSLVTISACKKVKKKPQTPMDMVLVPEGEFIMGTNEIDEEEKADMFGIPKPWFEDERPKAKIFVKSFYIDKFEVTNKKYKEFILSADYQQPQDWEYGTYKKGEDNFPVTYVAEYDVKRYAQWAGKAIPSEIEWEKAARGVDGKLYPWGNKFDLKNANISKSMNKVNKKGAVGLYKSGISPYGVYDMVGNVWEWTTSWYEPYKGNNIKRNEYGRKYKVIRGLSYFYLGHFPDDMYGDIVSHVSRSSFREEVYPTTKSPDLGFRCIKHIDK